MSAPRIIVKSGPGIHIGDYFMPAEPRIFEGHRLGARTIEHVAAVTILQKQDAARRAADRFVVGELQPGEPLVVDAAGADDVRREVLFRVEAPALADETDARQVQHVSGNRRN